jgi:hypothetical protein
MKTLCVLIFWASVAQAVLVENGQPRATIVVPVEASPTVREAARELSTYVEKSSGSTPDS